MPKTPKNEKGPTADELRARVLAVKPRLKGHSYIDIAAAAVPELNTAQGGIRIINIWSLKTTDERVTQAWEQAADQLEAGTPPIPLLRPREHAVAAA